MNRFATMNNVNAARAASPAAQSRPQPMSGGMQGTNMTPLAPPPPMASANPNQQVGNNPYARPAPQSAGAHLAGNINGGMMGTRPNTDMRIMGDDPSGPVPQNAPQQPPLDLNDPNNAAIAGYMAR